MSDKQTQLHRKSRAFADARRRAPRFPFHAQIDLLGMEDATGVTLDVSAGGLRVLVDTPLALGDVCELVIKSPTERVFRNTARVVWQEPGSEGRIVGLEFL